MTRINKKKKFGENKRFPTFSRFLQSLINIKHFFYFLVGFWTRSKYHFITHTPLLSIKKTRICMRIVFYTFMFPILYLSSYPKTTLLTCMH